MIKVTGFLEQVGDGPPIRRDTITCSHCNAVVILEERQITFKHFCTSCMKPICEQCSQNPSCEPFEKWLDRVEKEAYRWQQVTKLIGTR